MDIHTLTNSDSGNIALNGIIVRDIDNIEEIKDDGIDLNKYYLIKSDKPYKFEDILNVSSNTSQYEYTKNFILKYFIPILSFEINDIITIGDEIEVKNSISNKQYEYDALAMSNKFITSRNGRKLRFNDDTDTLFGMLAGGMLGAALLADENECHNDRDCDSYADYNDYSDSSNSGYDYDSYDSSESSSDSSSSCD